MEIQKSTEVSKELIHSLLARRQHAMAENRVWWSILRNAYFLSQPNRNVFLQEEAPGSQKNDQVYDITMVLATRTFVNKMQNSLVPQNINWFQFEPGLEVKREIDQQSFDSREVEFITDQLHKHTELFFDYLRDSNFDTVINEAFYDLAVGTATLQCNETDDDDQPFVFTAVPQDKIGFEEGLYGSIEGVFLDFTNIKLSVAKRMFGDDFVVPSKHRNKDQFKEDEDKLTLYMCSYYEASSKKYKTVVIDSESSEAVFEKTDESWEFIPFRWYKLAGEIRGRGPVLDAQPGGATINLAFRDELAASEIKSHPIYMGFDDGVFNPYTFKLRPNTILPVEAPGDSGMWPLAPLPQAGDISFSAIVINDIREQINKILFSSPLGPIQDAPPLTATEVSIRQNEMVEDAAASFARLQRELFKPLIKRVLYILRKKGKIGDIKVSDKIISLTFRTPLSLGKGQIDVNQLSQFRATLGQIIGEEAAAQMMKVAEIPHWVAKNMNVDPSLLVPQQMVEQAQAEGAEMLTNAVDEAMDGQ